MRKIYLLSTLLLLTIFYGSKSYAQDFSNKGKEFYLCFPQHVPSGTNLATLSIWITSDKASSGTVTMGNLAFSQPFNIAANGLAEIRIPHSIGHISNGESFTVIRKSIKIKVDPGKPAVVAYVQQWGAARSAASLLLPVNVLGKKYYSVNFTQSGTNQNPYFSKSQFQIIAVKDNTVVKITPKQNGVTGTATTVTLPLAGDMYQYQADQDLTGTLIETVASAGGGCVPVAVFSGSSGISWGSPSCNGTSYDPLFQQAYPISTWGKNFGFVPFADYPNGNSYRVLASEDNTSVYLDGVFVATINAGQIYPSAFTSNPVLTTTAKSISADKPICVAQYSPAQACGGGNFGDPDMVILNPIEQNISDITIFSSTQQSITRQWINVLMKTIAIPSFTINGITPFTPWTAVPSIPGYSYLRHLLPGSGSYRLKADSGFNAIAYGFSSNFESYAYSAGTNVRDLYQQIGTSTSYGGASSPSVCVGSSTRFKISLPYAADSIYWDFRGSQSPNVMLTNKPNPIIPDSIRTVNGKQVYWYSLPLQYIFNTPGTFPATITTYSQNADGCGGSEQEIETEIEVVNKPLADFNFTTDGCVSKPVTFTEANSSTRPVLTRYWDFGDLTNSTTAAPAHTYSAPGPYNIKYTYINDIGCIADTARKTVTLDPPPTANFSIAAGSYCPGNTISFTDLSTPALSTGTYTYAWDFGDATTSNLANPTHVYANPGNYTVTLKVTSPSGCASTVFTYPTPVTINAKPVVNFNLPGVCLPTGTAQFTEGSTPGSGSISTWAWNFGDASPVVTITAPASPNVTHNYATTGPFSVGLTVTNTNGCTDTKTQTLSTVYAEPQAAFTTAADVCLGSPSTFTETSIAPGSTVTEWTWDFGDLTPPVTIVSPGNPNISHTYAAPGPYIVKLNVKSAAGCVTVNKFAQQTVNVTSLPAASINITGATSACQNGTAPSVTFTGTGGSAPYTFTYSIDDGTGAVVQPPLTTVTGNSRTITAPTGTAGTFRYALVNVQEGSTASCSQAQTGFVNVLIRPLPGGAITGATSVCINSTSPNITFTGSNGTAPYTFAYRINGGPLLTVSTTAASNTVTVAVPTNTANTFTYALESVAESSANACSQNLTGGSAAVTVKPLPTATMVGSAEVCLNALTHDILFTGSNGTAPYTFSYRINGGPLLTVSSVAPSNTATVAVPTNTATTYTYTLVSVQETGSCSQPQTGTVTTKVNPLPVANFTPSAPNCQSRSITFTDASVPNAGNVVTWVWDFGDGSPLVTINAPASPNVTHTFALAQPYDVKLTVTTDKGCESVTTTKTITVNLNPTAAFTPPIACVADVAAKFTDNSTITPGSIVAWDWLFNDPNATGANPNTSTLQEPTHHFTVAGPYTVRQIVTSNTGCKDTTTRTFNINGLPNSDFTIENTGAVCANKAVDIKDATTLDFGSLTKVEIFWDFLNNPSVSETDNSPSSGKVYTHTYSEFGSPAARQFRIRYVTYSGNSCVSSFSRDVTLLATPMLQFDDVTGICADVPAFQVTQAQLLNTLPGTGVFTGTGISPAGLFNPGTAGTGAHTIRYTYNASNGCSNFVENIIEVYPVPSINAGPDKFVLEGGQVTLTPALNASSIPITYLWSPVTYLNDPTLPSAVSAPKDDITYILTVTSDKGCKASDDVFVKVLKRPLVPNIFSPNGDGIHDTWKLPYIDTYPGATIDIYNRYGQLVFHSTGYAREWDGKANGKDVPVGTYYFVVDPKNGRQKLAGYVDVIR